MSTWTELPETVLLLSDARGIYIPRDAADFVHLAISDDDRAILKAGPDHGDYWDVWVDVLDNAILTDPDTGVRYSLHQDGDLWAVPVGMEWEDETSSYVWPDDVLGLHRATAPAGWASYLLNGDTTGISSKERRAADDMLADVRTAILDAGGDPGPSRDPLDCRDAGFMHRMGYGSCAGDAQEYIFRAGPVNYARAMELNKG